MSELRLKDQDGRELYRPVVVADSFISRLMGLMFVPAGTERALLISPCSSVHTFWMRYNLDILFMNEEGKVLRIVENAPPRRTYFCWGAKTVLECAVGLLPLKRLEEREIELKVL